jgi:hypothetical protein
MNLIAIGILQAIHVRGRLGGAPLRRSARLW